MPNQALAFHRVSRHVYDLTGLRTGSVRDQLLRSSLVIHCLFDEGLISRSQPLLVLGAGAAGINAAITAADLGVTVDVIELNVDPFASFRLASWRRIDPVEYDWPHSHYNAGVFPSSGAGIPLVQHSGTGDDLAQDWAVFWQWWYRHCNQVAGRGAVHLLSATNARQFKAGIQEAVGNAHVDVRGPWPSAAGVTTRSFGAVLSCAGFGPERTADLQVPSRWGGYVGPAFWLDDDRISPGHAGTMGIDRVLISGGGDGALQDVQRVLTGAFGKALLHLLSASADAHGVALFPPTMISTFLQADDKGRRAYAWQRDKQPIAQDMAAWHDAFATEVNTWFAALSRSSLAALQQIAADVLRPELLSGQMAVTWVYKEASPGYAYALNRYLTLVLQALTLVQASSGLLPRVDVFAEHEVVQIKPSQSGHRCTSPATCWGVPHDVTLQAVPAGAKVCVNDVQLIIVRHGALPDPLLAGAAVREQMTPFDFPQ